MIMLGLRLKMLKTINKRKTKSEILPLGKNKTPVPTKALVNKKNDFLTDVPEI